MYIWQRTLFCTHILASERLDMAHSVESRYPFLDNRVVAVARRLPDTSLVSGYRDKKFLRNAAESWLPASACNRAKQPFEAPYLFARPGGEFAEYLQDTLTDQALRNSGIFDAGVIGGLLDRWHALPPKIAGRMDMVVMAILSVLALEKRFGVTSE